MKPAQAGDRQRASTGWAGWLAVSFLGWSLYGLLWTVQFQVYVWSRGEIRPFASFVVPMFVSMWTWALISPCIVGVTRRWPLRPGALRVHGAVHFGFFVVLLLGEASFRAFWDATGAVGLSDVVDQVFGMVDVNVLAYLAVAAVAHVLLAQEDYDRAQSERLLTQAGRDRAEAFALRMQLQPHFILNALHAVSELIREDQDAARDMVAGIEGIVLRTGLISGRDEVPLSEEVALARDYLAVQRCRMRERLQVEIQVPDDLRDALVPSFILQPLVENAVVHGVARRPRGGAVRVVASRLHDDLQLEIYNDGSLVPHRGGLGGEGMGLRNTRQRLELLHGLRQSVVLQGMDDQATVLRVRIPLRRAQEPLVDLSVPAVRSLGGTKVDEWDFDDRLDKPAWQLRLS